MILPTAGSTNASNLPISDNDWPIFDYFMQELDISWRGGSELNLHDTKI
jgi:hypothetical protein